MAAHSIRLLAFAVVVALCAPDAAYADDSEDAATARALFTEGVHLLRIGQYAQACGKFEASLQHYNGVGTRGKLAECYESWVGSPARGACTARSPNSVDKTETTSA